MEELIKILNIRELRYLHLEYVDNYGNVKVLHFDYPSENSKVKGENNG